VNGNIGPDPIVLVVLVVIAVAIVLWSRRH